MKITTYLEIQLYFVKNVNLGHLQKLQIFCKLAVKFKEVCLDLGKRSNTDQDKTQNINPKRQSSTQNR